MASISKTVRPKRSNNATVNPVGMGLTVGRGTPVASATAGATILFQEGFESGTLSGGWFDGTSVPVAGEARPGSSGTSAMAWSWALGATQPTGVGSCRRDFTPTDRVYFSYWIKCSSNWVGSGVAFHPHMFHFLTTADDHYIGPSKTHLTTYDELLYTTGGMVYQMSLQDSLNIDTGNLLVDLTGVTENRAVCGYNGRPETGMVWDAYDNGGGDYRNYKTLVSPSLVLTDANKNQWHHFESYWQMNTISGGIGQPDGVMQLWVDGVQIHNRTDVYFRTNANPTMQFRTFVMAPYMQVGAPVAQSMWIDDITISTGRTEGTPAVASAAVSGTGVGSWYESDVVGGGDTLILTLTGDTWVAAGATFDGQRQAIIDGLVSTGAETHGWNVERANIPTSALIRTSDTVATLTMPVLGAYSITVSEALTWTVPATAVVGGVAIVAETAIAILEGTPAISAQNPNEPVGYTYINQRSFNAVSETGWGSSGTTYAAIVTDATAPISPSNVMRITYPAGYAAGDAPWHGGYTIGGSRTGLYYHYTLKHSANFQGQSSGTNKIGYIWVHGNPAVFFSAEGTGSGALEAQFRLQNVPDSRGRLRPNLGTTAQQTMVRDVWNDLEIQIIANTPGVANGVARWWLNGVHIGEYTDVQYASAAQANTWQEASIYPIWGGVGGTVTNEMYIYFDHFYMSGA